MAIYRASLPSADSVYPRLLTEQNCDPVRGEIARRQAVFLDIEPGFETAEAIRNRANGQ